MTLDITLDRSEATTSHPEYVNKVQTQKQKIGCSGHHAEELYYQTKGGNKSHKRTVRETNRHCVCEKLIKAVLSECSCFKAIPSKVSVFQRLSTEMSKPKPRHFCKRKSVVQDDKFPKVTINVADKRKSKRHSSESNPDFSPGGKVNSRIAQRMSQLQLGAIRRR